MKYIFAYVFNSVPFECISWFVIYAQGFSKATATSDASAVSDIAHKKLVISARRKCIAFLTDISFEGQNLHVFIPYEMKSASLHTCIMRWSPSTQTFHPWVFRLCAWPRHIQESSKKTIWRDFFTRFVQWPNLLSPKNLTSYKSYSPPQLLLSCLMRAAAICKLGQCKTIDNGAKYFVETH